MSGIHAFTVVVTAASYTYILSQVLQELLKEICKALLEADVNIKLVKRLRENIKYVCPIIYIRFSSLHFFVHIENVLTLMKWPLASTNVGSSNQLFSTSCVRYVLRSHAVPTSSVIFFPQQLLDPGVPAWQPSKGKPNVIMFVGLQGSGKTTTCTKVSGNTLIEHTPCS